MTNRELLQAPKETLSAAQRQRQHLLQLASTSRPCPACLQGVAVLDATGLDIDAYRFDQPNVGYRCPHCGAELEQHVPVLATGWYWQLQLAWLAERLHRANLYDQQHPGGKP